MSEGLTIITEQVDAFPSMMSLMKHMSIADLMNGLFPVHGDWHRLSLGLTPTGWLGRILSVGGHRLNHVQPCLERNPPTVQRSLGQAFTGLEYSDDRLESVLDALGDDENLTVFEVKLNHRTLCRYTT